MILHFAKKSFLVLIVLSTLFTACKKEEIQGPKGEPGTPGGGGNASISSGDVFTIGSANWLPNADSSAWQVVISSTLITQSIVDKGVVKVFQQKGSSWWELPYTEGDLFTQFGFQTGSVTLTFMDIHGGLPTKPATTNYRISVFLASARVAGAQGQASQNNNSVNEIPNR